MLRFAQMIDVNALQKFGGTAEYDGPDSFGLLSKYRQDNEFISGQGRRTLGFKTKLTVIHYASVLFTQFTFCCYSKYIPAPRQCRPIVGACLFDLGL